MGGDDAGSQPRPRGGGRDGRRADGTRGATRPSRGRRAGVRAAAREEQAKLLARLVRDAERIAPHFGLRYASIEAERPSVTRRYGVCFQDGRIRIRLRHASTGRPLKYSSLVNTLCHELAHLRHFNHGPRFKAFYLRILEWARREGIYRPGHEETATPPRLAAPAAAPAHAIARAKPVQLGLFG